MASVGTNIVSKHSACYFPLSSLPSFPIFTPVPSPAVQVPSRPCPVCDSMGPRRLIHRQRFFEGVLGDGYDVVVCANCGAGFADGIPSQAEMNRYYAEQSKYAYEGSGGAESPYDLARFELIADQIAPYLPSKDARILDIGCATGGLLAAFKRRGFTRLMGADPSPACAAAVRRLHGIDARAATIEDLRKWNDRFDVIFMIGVLEHLREVKPALEIAAGKLAGRESGKLESETSSAPHLASDSSYLFIGVPDVEGLAGARNAPFQQFSMEHVNFFSKASLRGTLTAIGGREVHTWQNTVEWRQGVTEPVLAMLATVDTQGIEIQNRESKVGNSRDLITEPALRAYVAVSSDQQAFVADTIALLAKSREPILVWGTGALTRRLLAEGELGKANIVAFVDSSARPGAGTLSGKPILAPAELAARPESILVCSVAFEAEIVQAIRHLPNPIIRLGRGAGE